MDSVKYIGLDVHRDTISVAVVDQSGRLVMQSVIPTQAPAIVDCVGGIQGSQGLQSRA
jgi:predicted NBD/HSP70 family sugar kinase